MKTLCCLPGVEEGNYSDDFEKKTRKDIGIATIPNTSFDSLPAKLIEMILLLPILVGNNYGW